MKLPEKIHLSVVIPAYNEERTIAETLRRVEAYLSLRGWEWEILVSSDGCTDNTVPIVREKAAGRQDGRVRLLSDDKNRGKGASVRKAMLEAKGDFILVTDADLSAPIKEVDRLLEAMVEGYDVAIGSRDKRAPGVDVQQSFKRWLAGRVFNALVRVILLGGFSDTQCGFKCFKRGAARRLFSMQKLDGFSFDVEVLYLAVRLGLRVKEVPVMWRQGPRTHVKLLRDSTAMVKDLFYLRSYWTPSSRRPVGV